MRAQNGTLRGKGDNRPAPPSIVRHTARHSPCRGHAGVGAMAKQEAGRKGGDAKGRRAAAMRPRSHCGRPSSTAPLEAKQPTGLACATQHGTSCGVHSLGRGAVREARKRPGGGECRGRQHAPWTRPRHGVGSGERRGGSGVAGPRTQEQREEERLVGAPARASITYYVVGIPIYITYRNLLLFRTRHVYVVRVGIPN